MTKLFLSVIMTAWAFSGAVFASSSRQVNDSKGFVADGAAEAVQRPVRYDFDGDGKADISVFRPSNGVWYIANSGTGGFSIFQFGLNGDIPIAADYDGDAKTDAAVYRGGIWYRLRSATSTVDIINFGLQTDIPVPSDFDGDGKFDAAIFRPSNGTWHRLNSSNSQYVALQFGSNGDIPIAGDFDADGLADINVFRPSNGVWYRINSSNSSVSSTGFGINGDIPLAGDFDGDLKADLAIWRPSTSSWWILRSSDASYLTMVFGLSTDIPVPADYDGDGKTDIAVFRPSDGVWHRIQSGSGTYLAYQFGVSTDVPVTTPMPPVPTSTPPAAFTCDYYASPTGTATGSGSSSSPWDLQTALGKTTLVRAGKTLCLKGGTYSGKFRSTLNGGGIVRSAPNEWAKIDGYRTTALVSAINSTQTSFAVADASGIFTGGTDEIVIDSEVIKVTAKSGNTITNCIRGASGSVTGATTHLAAANIIIGGTQFYVAGSNTTYRDFEVMNSYPNRDGNVNYPELIRGNGVVNVGDSNKFVNLIVHDNVSGFFTSGVSSNTEIYGSLTYNNGFHDRPVGSSEEEGKGHGMYLENSAGYSKIYEDISLNNFNLGTQCFGATAPYVGGDINGSVFANSGSPLGKFGNTARRNLNLIVGTESQRIPSATLRNSYFFHPFTSYGSALYFGYGAGVTSGTVTDNTIVGGTGLLEVRNTTSATVTGNKVYSSNSEAVYTITDSGTSYTWNSNVYYGTLNQDSFGCPGVGLCLFPLWRLGTGYDLTSTETASAMPNTVIVRPNSYQPGRANVIIYNSNGASTASINLSTTGLVNGQQYTIRNVQNYFGSPVATGTYSSASPTISVSLTGAALTVAGPIGYNYTPPTTCPQFCPLVVVPN